MADDMPEPPGTYTLTTDAGEKTCSIGHSGMGKAAYPNGDIYEGQFVDGKRVGKGSYRYINGDVFEGTFADNKKTGLGRLTYAAGGFFHGHFLEGRREGEGTFKYANGDIYSGMWKDGKRHGKGTYVFANAKYAYTGDWKDGFIQQGTWSLTDGTTYVGSFKHQMPCGDAIWQTAKGTVVEGAYVQQVLPLDEDKPKLGAPPATEIRIFWKTAATVAAED
mmetsp:Transcript_41083/g.89772  ORF Transcript_41083/g.89772 Transcript_41083/m.89772 type:complete len:220 (-) Transcript_41083:87-746(-)